MLITWKIKSSLKYKDFCLEKLDNMLSQLATVETKKIYQPNISLLRIAVNDLLFFETTQNYLNFSTPCSFLSKS